MSSRTSADGLMRKGLPVYMPQNWQSPCEHPYMTWRMRLSASLGGR